jgi:AAA family ATP:ADP antiporter
MPESRPHTFARLANRVLAGATDIRVGEGRAVLASGLLFFLVLAASMVLRPVREAMGLYRGIETVRLLFFCTVIATVPLAPAFGYLVARVRRHAFMAISFRVCALIMLGFFLSLILLPDRVKYIPGMIYYVFHSVFNLFAVSLFWAFMADLFDVVESKRLFPAIAVGGTLGAIAGSILSEQLVAWSGRATPWLGASVLFVVAAGLLEAAVWTSALVARIRNDAAPRETTTQPIGGNALAGMTVLARSPYLLGIAMLFVFTAVISTFFYFVGMRIVEQAAESVQERTILFARINLRVQVATLIAQAFVAGRIMRFMGVGTALAALPACAAAGLGMLAAMPTLAAYEIINALYRAVQRGIARPARETLFTVVSREDKYKAKSFLDTFVFRAGDAAAAQLERPLATGVWGLGGIASAVVPIAMAWIMLCVYLSSSQSKLASRKRA